MAEDGGMNQLPYSVVERIAEKIRKIRAQKEAEAAQAAAVAAAPEKFCARCRRELAKTPAKPRGKKSRGLEKPAASATVSRET